MDTGQTPKTKGLALGRMEKLAFQGLLAHQREVERLSAELRAGHDEFLSEVEERLEMPGALTGSPPTHYVDQSSWNVIEIPTAPPADEPNGTGTSKIHTHVEADRIAAELGITFDKGATVKQKVERIETHRVEAAAAVEA